MNIKPKLQSHKLWLESNGKQGQRADLSGLVFEKQDFRGINLSNAILINTRFIECNLNGADFHCAIAEFADFKRSQLAGVNFRGARLKASNFFKAKLMGTMFSGADIGHCEFSQSKYWR